MTEQARQDLLTIVKASELPTAIVERRVEWDRRTRLLSEEIEPHRNDNGTYNLKLVTKISGKDVSELEKSDKLQAIWKETREVQDLFEEMSDLANIHEERRRLARQQLNGIERRDIRFEGSEEPRHIEPLTKAAIEVFKTKSPKDWSEFGDLELRDLLSTTDSWTPEVTRTGKVQMIGHQVPNLLQLFRQGSTTQSAVKYEEEIVEVSNMRTIHEARKYPEGKVRIVTRRAEIEKIGTTLRVTDEELEDEVRMRGYMQVKLPNWLNRRIDSYILYGLSPVTSGDSDDQYPEFGGLARMGVRTGASTTGAEGETDADAFQRDGDAASQAGTDQGTAAVVMAKTGAISIPNLIRKGFAQIMVNYGMPGPVIMHPFDWNEIATLQTADGHYIWSHPSQNPTPMIWGQRIVENTGVTEGHAWTGDFANHAEWVNRKGVMIEWGMANDDFLRDIRRVKICIRAGVIFYRPKVFVQYTNLND